MKIKILNLYWQMLWDYIIIHIFDYVPVLLHLLPQGFSSLNHPPERVKFLMYCRCAFEFLIRWLFDDLLQRVLKKANSQFQKCLARTHTHTRTRTRTHTHTHTHTQSIFNYNLFYLLLEMNIFLSLFVLKQKMVVVSKYQATLE